VSNEQQAQQADDPSGPGWRWVRQGEALRHGDVEHIDGDWHPTIEAGYTCPRNHSYRRRIEPQQPSDSEPETMEDLRRRLAECEVLLVEAERGGQQVNAELQQLREQVQDLTRQTQVDALELQQLREQVQTLTRKLKDANDTYQICLQSHWKAGRRSAIDKLQTWLKPVLEVVADHPDDTSILAVSVLEFLPQIASRLIEE
jgi:hypothetical protein